ncbi:MAG: class I SAM-dependent methyltransferase [Kiritimatiellia bacterium]
MLELRQPLLPADNWQDYELIDCGGGHRLERWGELRLIRPDPQAIWAPASPALWDDWDGRYHRHADGGGRWEKRRSLPETWVMRYRQLRFHVRPTGFKHLGLFPEQAPNWDWFCELINHANRPLQVLNLFGYTGAATAAAAAAGAAVCHVDAARGMVQWCRENIALSGLGDAPVRYIVDDCLAFVRREKRRGRLYDAIIMDPPSYGRGSRGELWKLEEHLVALLEACVSVLAPNPLFVLVNAYTTGLSPTVLANLLNDALAGKAGRVYGGELGLRATAGGRILPSGIYARWQG